MQLLRPGTITHNSLQTMAVYALRLGLQLALLLLVARFLGPANYGEFAAITALAFGLGTLSSFGLGFLVLGESAKSPTAGQAILAQAIPTTFLSAILLLSVYFWLSLSVIGSSANLIILGLIGITELLLVPLLGLLSFRLQGLGHIAYSQALALLPMLLRLAGLTACFALSPENVLYAYALVHSLGSAAGLGAAAWIVGRVIPIGRIELPSLKTLRRGPSFAVMNFMAANPSELDKALSLRLLGASETGLYALASRGMSVVTLPVVAMILAAQPRIFRASDNPHAAGRLITTAMAAAFAYGLVAAAFLYLVAPPLLQHALGEDYQDIGDVVALIALIAPFMTTRFAGGGILLALGRPLLRTSLESVALLLLIVLALTLAPHHGIQGLIWAVLASEAAMAILSSLFLLHHFRQSSQIAARASANDSGREKHPS